MFGVDIEEVVIIEPKIYKDERGFFFESFNEQTFADRIDSSVRFVQDNQSLSHRNVLRGLHYQIEERAQGKLVRAVSGEIFDVAVDIRKSSPTFGHWKAEILSAENCKQLWVPPGFAHGFLVMSDGAEVLYKITDYYAPAHERCIRWDDPQLQIDWPQTCDRQQLIISDKDRQSKLFCDAELFL
jgi:dTDP-4-dehydrorhamnose 3,5-epimerase